MKITKQGETSPVRSCNSHGCPRLAVGMVRMNIPNMLAPTKTPTLQMPVALILCATCIKVASAQMFMTTEWQQQVLVVLKNRGAVGQPDFASAWLDLVPFGEPNVVSEGVHHAAD
jgi:hypothetical protein